MIREKELERMRAIQNQFLPDLCQVVRPSQTLNEAGRPEQVYVTMYLDLPCEATPKVLRQILEAEAGGQISSAVRWNITMPYGTEIELNDRIYTNEHYYEVNGLQSIESYETAVVAQCLRVE